MTLPEELHDLVRDVVADLESATDSLDLGGARPARQAPRRDRRRTPQATILRLPEAAAAAPTVPAAAAVPTFTAAPRPAPPPAAPPAFESSVPVPPAAPRRRAFLARLEVASTVPGVALPARTRRLQVACRRASPLDATRISRMLRVAVPAIPVAPATLASPPAWLLAAMAPPISAPLPEQQAAAPQEATAVILAGRTAAAPIEAEGPPAAVAAPAVASPAPVVVSPAPVSVPATLPAATLEERLPGWRDAGGHAVNLLIAAALGLVAIFCAIVVGLVVTGHHLEEVVTGSMQPTIPIGSLVVTESLPAGQLHVGNILVFPDPNNTKLTIVHRIVWLSHDQSGDVLVRTKGDYNALPDMWTLKRAANAQADKVIEILPGAGTAAGYLQTAGFAGLVLLIAGVIVYYGVRKVREILDEDEVDERAVGATEPLT
ncbi:MAG: signal peptidase I [Candidatus Dormibacteria bacterium]